MLNCGIDCWSIGAIGIPYGVMIGAAAIVVGYGESTTTLAYPNPTCCCDCCCDLGCITGDWAAIVMVAESGVSPRVSSGAAGQKRFFWNCLFLWQGVCFKKSVGK